MISVRAAAGLPASNAKHAAQAAHSAAMCEAEAAACELGAGERGAAEGAAPCLLLAPDAGEQMCVCVCECACFGCGKPALDADG
jgi:hypothetical protein